jgi:hypothetical protein
MALTPIEPLYSPPSTPAAGLIQTCTQELTWLHWKLRSHKSQRSVEELHSRVKKLQYDLEVYRSHFERQGAHIPSATQISPTEGAKRTRDMQSQLRRLTKAWHDDME